jgi:signal transduction histidine kinase
MLYQFLIDNRTKILAISKMKTADIADDRPISDESQRDLPLFYDHLVCELARQSKGLPARGDERKHGAKSTAAHGKELSRLGYTVSQVVHGYGVLCQAITELAQATKAPITAGEFSMLNFTLDVAIADAVTGFSEQIGLEGVDSAKRMGFLVHELRNSLAAAIIAHSLVKSGTVGPASSTNALLERNLKRMRDILDRSFSEVRLHRDPIIERRPVRLIKIAEEVEATAVEEARSRDLSIAVSVPPALQVQGDRNYLVSALSNLVQNAIKYSKQGGRIVIRGRDTVTNVLLEVEDQCGGLPKGKAEELFQPFTQKSEDRTGLGLGLSISRQAVTLHGGTLAVRDVPGTGCVFTIALPKRTVRPASPRPHPGRPRMMHKRAAPLSKRKN